MKKQTEKLVSLATALGALLALFATPGRSSVLPLVQDEAPADEGAGAEGEDEAEDEDEEERWYAITGGDVYTGAGAVLRGATVLSKNGRITEIGYNLFLPEGTEVLDATGYRVYPGLVAVEATTRISRGLFSSDGFDPSESSDEGDGEGEESGAQAATDPLHPDDDWESAAAGALAADEAPDIALDGAGQAEEGGGKAKSKRDERPEFEHGFDPFSTYLVMALATGITTADQAGVAAKLKRGEIDGVAMKEKYLVSFSWLPSARSGVREKFERAAKYLRDYEAYEEKKKTDKDAKEPSKKGLDTSVVDVLQGRKLAKFSADNREELLGIARFAQKYHFRPVIQGCREGWTVAEELGRAGAFAIVTPRSRRPKDERLVREGGSSIENAAILHRSGVQVAIIPANTSIDLGGITGRDLLHFPIEAAFAVRGGLSEDAALAGITIVPARILGVDHRVGTLEPGKDMDAIVTDGDVLHYQTFVQWAVVDGKLVYDKEKELLFHHIRPRPAPPMSEVEEPPAQAEDEQAEEVEEEDAGAEEGEGEEQETGGEEGGDDPEGGGR